MMARTTDDRDPLFATVKASGGFVWNHLMSIILISVCWFLASIPLVTLGPATVGAYRAVLSLRATGSVDQSAVLATVRDQFVHTTLLGLLPLVLLAMTVTYAVSYLTTGALLSGLLALGGFYVTLYLGLVLVPTFVVLATGASVGESVAAGYLWTARHATEAVALGVVTAILLLVTSLMTIAVVLVFAGAAFVFHVEFVTGVDDTGRIAPEVGA